MIEKMLSHHYLGTIHSVFLSSLTLSYESRMTNDSASVGLATAEHPPPLGYRRVMRRYRGQCLVRIGRYRHVRNVTALWTCVLLRLRTDVSEGTLFGRLEACDLLRFLC
jgi:hypothetical protein